MNTDFIEIISNKTSKANAIYKLMDHCGKIDKSNVYTIGDSYSDMEMVGEFNGFCIRGSVPELKAIANAEYSSVSLLLKDIIEGKRLYDKATEIYETWVFAPYCGLVHKDIIKQDILYLDWLRKCAKTRFLAFQS